MSLILPFQFIKQANSALLICNFTHSALFSVFVEESSKKKKNPMDFIKALAILKVNPRKLKEKILEAGCEEVLFFIYHRLMVIF